MEFRDIDRVNSSGQMFLYTMMLKMLLDHSQIMLENINMVFPVAQKVACSTSNTMGSIPREIKNWSNVNVYIECQTHKSKWASCSEQTCKVHATLRAKNIKFPLALDFFNHTVYVLQLKCCCLIFGSLWRGRPVSQEVKIWPLPELTQTPCSLLWLTEW